VRRHKPALTLTVAGSVSFLCLGFLALATLHVIFLFLTLLLVFIPLFAAKSRPCEGFSQDPRPTPSTEYLCSTKSFSIHRKGNLLVAEESGVAAA